MFAEVLTSVFCAELLMSVLCAEVLTSVFCAEVFMSVLYAEVLTSVLCAGLSCRVRTLRRMMCAPSATAGLSSARARPGHGFARSHLTRPAAGLETEPRFDPSGRQPVVRAC